MLENAFFDRELNRLIAFVLQWSLTYRSTIVTAGSN